MALGSGVAIAGDSGKARVFGGSLAYAGQAGCARGGARDYCIVQGGGGVSHTGDGGIAITTVNGESIVEGWGVAIALEGGIVSAWEGVIIIGYPIDGGRHHARVGVIGCGGLKPNTRYTLDQNQNFVEATAPVSKVCDGV